MVILDKSLVENEVILSINGLVEAVSPVFSMKFYSTYTKKEFTLTLGTSASCYPDRFLQFTVSNVTFSTWEEGLFVYEVYDTAEMDGNVLEYGVARVIKSASPLGETISIIPDESEDDMVVYNN